MNIEKASTLYEFLRASAEQAFNIVFSKDQIPEDSNVSLSTLTNNMDQYLQCAIVKALIAKKSLDDEHLAAVKNLVKYDCFINVPSISSNVVNQTGIEKYVDECIKGVPLFFALIIHLDEVCKTANNDFDTKLSRDVFELVVEIIKAIVPYGKVGELAEVLYSILKPVILKYQEAGLNYQQ